MTSHVCLTDLDWQESATAQDVQIARVQLDTYDTAWKPGSTKRPIHGPCNIRYTRYPDGGIDVVVSPRERG